MSEIKNENKNNVDLEINNTIIGNPNSILIEMTFRDFCDNFIRQLNNLYDLFNFININNITIYELYEKIDPIGFDVITKKCLNYLKIVVLYTRIYNPTLNLDDAPFEQYESEFKNANGIWKYCLLFALNNNYFNEIIYNNCPIANLNVKVDITIDNFVNKLCELQNRLNEIICYKLRNKIQSKNCKLALDEIITFDDKTIDKMADVVISHY